MQVIGAISGTSVDGIDVAWVEITAGTEALSAAQPLSIMCHSAETIAYTPALQARLTAAIAGTALSAAAWDALDYDVALAFAAAIQTQVALAQAAGVSIDLVGSHGQTVWHRPPEQDSGRDRLGFSWQLGRGDVIAHHLGIPTVSQFRQADISAGGHGAPLVSHLDVWLAQGQRCCWQNLGGIANVTYSDGETVLGFDNGPANVLLDGAARYLLGHACDRDGALARQGTPQMALVTQWLKDPYLQQAPPKSTGREYFDTAYLERCLAPMTRLSLADQFATLTEFTALAIATSYQQFLPHMPAQVWLSGGGVRNLALVERLQHHLAPIPVASSAQAGIDPDFKEAIAFAWLAYRRWHNLPSNVPAVTGAAKAISLGVIAHPCA